MLTEPQEKIIWREINGQKIAVKVIAGKEREANQLADALVREKILGK